MSIGAHMRGRMLEVVLEVLETVIGVDFAREDIIDRSDKPRLLQTISRHTTPQAVDSCTPMCSVNKESQQSFSQAK